MSRVRDAIVNLRQLPLTKSDIGLGDVVNLPYTNDVSETSANFYVTPKVAFDLKEELKDSLLEVTGGIVQCFRLRANITPNIIYQGENFLGISAFYHQVEKVYYVGIPPHIDMSDITINVMPYATTPCVPIVERNGSTFKIYTMNRPTLEQNLLVWVTRDV